jgi:hypothetical protein
MDSEKKNVKILRTFSYIYQKKCTSFIFTSLSRKFYGQNDEKKNLFLLYPIKNKKVCPNEFSSSFAFNGPSTIILIESYSFAHSVFFVLHTSKINKSRTFFGLFFSVEKTRFFRQFRRDFTVKKIQKNGIKKTCEIDPFYTQLISCFCKTIVLANHTDYIILSIQTYIFKYV